MQVPCVWCRRSQHSITAFHNDECAASPCCAVKCGYDEYTRAVFVDIWVQGHGGNSFRLDPDQSVAARDTPNKDGVDIFRLKHNSNDADGAALLTIYPGIAQTIIIICADDPILNAVP
jgi:hypothetical protein